MLQVTTYCVFSGCVVRMQACVCLHLLVSLADR